MKTTSILLTLLFFCAVVGVYMAQANRIEPITTNHQLDINEISSVNSQTLTEDKIKLQKWEYKIVVLRSADAGPVERALLKCGEDNWELVAFTPRGHPVLKRPVNSSNLSADRCG